MILLQRLMAPIINDQLERVSQGRTATFPFSLLSQRSMGEFFSQYHYGLNLVQSVLILLGILFLAGIGSESRTSNDSTSSPTRSETDDHAPA